MRSLSCSAQEEIFIGSFADFSQQFPEKSKECVTQQNNLVAQYVEDSTMESLVLYVPKNFHATTPLIVHNKIPAHVANVTNKILIFVDDGASVEIQELTQAVHGSAIVYKSIQCIIKDNAQVKFIIEQSKAFSAQVFTNYNFYLYTYSTLFCTAGFRESAYTKAFLAVLLQEKHTNATFKGGYLLRENEQIEITSHLQHVAALGTSSLHLHGALFDSAKAKYNGTIEVAQTAHSTNTEQYNKNMLLSSGTQAVSVPNLEVLPKQVQCRHGSAIGRFDKQMLFYIYSRGLSSTQAEKLLLSAFFKQVNLRDFI